MDKSTLEIFQEKIGSPNRLSAFSVRHKMAISVLLVLCIATFLILDSAIIPGTVIFSDNFLNMPILGFLVLALGFMLGKYLNLSIANPHIQELVKSNEELNRQNKLLLDRDYSLSVANEKLQNQDAARSEFVSIVSHQLRTPLAGTKWTLDMFINGDMGELGVEQKTLLQKVSDSNNRMIQFVNDLLSISRIDTGRLEFNFVPVDLERILESVLIDIYPLSNKKQITINFRGKGLKLPKVDADPDKIRAVFQNLIENSVKYTSNGGHVTVELRNRGPEIMVSVVDDGMGIPKDEQKNIFTRFYRAPNAVKMYTEGSGLGLYLVYNIVKGHGGKVWFESDGGKGSAFYFTIPIPQK